MKPRAFNPGSAAVLLAVLPMLQGCAVKALRIHNDEIKDARELTAVSSGSQVVPGGGASPVEVSLSKLKFINGAGHEFEDAVQFEAFKNLQTSYHYLEGRLQRAFDALTRDGLTTLEVPGRSDIPGWLSGRTGEYREKWLQKARERYAEEMRDFHLKYLKPTYWLEVKIAPKTLNADGKVPEPSVKKIEIGEKRNAAAWLGFRLNDAEGKTMLPKDRPRLNLNRTGFHGSIFRLLETPEKLKYVELKVEDKKDALDTFGGSDFQGRVGNYTVADATLTVVQYAALIPREIVKTPFMLLTPYNWDTMVSLDRFLLDVEDDDPVRFASMPVQCNHDFAKANAAGDPDPDRTLAVLKPESAAVFSVEVELTRESRLNREIQKLRDRIRQFNFAEQALEAEYGAAGRRVGRAIDERLQGALLEQIDDRYFTKESIFKGSAEVRPGAGTHGGETLTFENEKAAAGLDAALNGSEPGAKSRNLFQLSLNLRKANP